MISIQVNVGGLIKSDHFALVPAHKFSFSSSLGKSRKQFSRAWDHLKLDPYMADRGRYRFRRYGLFNLSTITGRLNYIPDASFYQGKTRPHLIPLILGHEILGHIAEIGKEAARGYQIREGDRVVVESSIRCGRCPYCEQGNYQLCDNHRSYGTSMTLSTPPHLWGAYGEYLYIAPGSVLHPISESVPAEAAVLACSVVADGIQWVRDMGQVQPGHTVLIQGAGQQGLAAAVAARECGAEQIIVTGMSRDERRLELARKLGASATIDVEKEDVQERINELTDTALADLVVDGESSPAALADLVQARFTPSG